MTDVLTRPIRTIRSNGNGEDDPLWRHVLFLIGNDNGASGSTDVIDQSWHGHTVRNLGTLPEQAFYASSPPPPTGMQTTLLFRPASELRISHLAGGYWQFGNADLCIEAFIRLHEDVVIFADERERAFKIARDGDDLRASFSGDGSTWNLLDNVSLGTIPNGWFHFAVYRIGTHFYGSISGAVQQLGTVSADQIIVPTNADFVISAGENGQLCSFRVTHGDARYGTTTFEPPELPMPDTGEIPPVPPPTVFTRLHGVVGTPFIYAINATGDPIEYTAPRGLPPGLTLDPISGVISGVPSVAGTFEVELRATNASGESVCGMIVLITIDPLPVPLPHITSSLWETAYQGEPFTYQITADNFPTSFNATELPEGLSINTETGVISGTPMSAPGPYDIPISATNEFGTGTATLRLNLEPARPPALAPVITSPDTASGTVGNSFVYVITARNYPYFFNAEGLPNGLSINTQTGTITGWPTEEGTFHVTLSAGNNDGIGTMMLTITVGPTPDRPCPPSPPRKNMSGPDVPDIYCRPPDGCCGPDICLLDKEDFICQIRSLLPEGEIFNNTRKSQAQPARNVGTITIGCARIGCEQLIFGGCCQDEIFCDDDPIAPQLAVVDSFAAAVYLVVQALCQMLPELDPCTANQFVERWAERMGITRNTPEFDPCGPEFSYKVLAFLICFVLQLRYNRQRAVNWDFLTMVANRMGADIKMRYAGDMNGVANTEEPYLGGWWSMARDQPVCPPRDPCPPDPKAELGAFYDRRLGGRALDPVACAPPNENSPMSLNIVICPSDIIVPANCNLPLEQQKSPLPHDPELYDAFWWLLPQLLPRGPLYCLYECCPADCIV